MQVWYYHHHAKTIAGEYDGDGVYNESAFNRNNIYKFNRIITTHTPTSRYIFNFLCMKIEQDEWEPLSDFLECAEFWGANHDQHGYKNHQRGIVELWMGLTWGRKEATTNHEKEIRDDTSGSMSVENIPYNKMKNK